MYKIKKIKNFDVYYSNKLSVEHFFTTRNLIVKDNPDLISDYLKVPKENILHPNQIHSANIEFV